MSDIDVFADSEEMSGTTEEGMKDVTVLCKRMLTAAEEVAAIEDALKEAKKRHTGIMLEVASAMDAANMKQFETADGKTIKLNRVTRAAIPKNEAQAAAAEKWLLENGHGDLIKYTVEAKLDRNQHNMVGGILATLKENYGVEAVSRASVHAQTLSAWVREQQGKGKELPEDLLGIYVQTDIKVK